MKMKKKTKSTFFDFDINYIGGPILKPKET